MRSVSAMRFRTRASASSGSYGVYGCDALFTCEDPWRTRQEITIGERSFYTSARSQKTLTTNLTYVVIDGGCVLLESVRGSPPPVWNRPAPLRRHDLGRFVRRSEVVQWGILLLGVYLLRHRLIHTMSRPLHLRGHPRISMLTRRVPSVRGSRWHRHWLRLIVGRAWLVVGRARHRGHVLLSLHGGVVPRCPSRAHVPESLHLSWSGIHALIDVDRLRYALLCGLPWVGSWCLPRRPDIWRLEPTVGRRNRKILMHGSRRARRRQRRRVLRAWSH